MSTVTPKIMSSPGVGAGQRVHLDYFFTVNSGAATLLPSGNNPTPIVFGYTAAAPLTTAAIDAYTGKTNDILGDTCFAATAMGTDSMGFVIDMNGQAALAVAIVGVLYDTVTLGTAIAGVATALTNSLSTAVSVSPLGNIYGRVVVAGFDAASTKILHLKIVCSLK